jgi:hypothetical protein
MTDMNMIRIIPFYGKVDEWPIWSERFLAKSRRFGFKVLLLETLSISTADENFDEGIKSGKKKSIAIEMNEIAYTELILSIDVKTSSGKVAFNLIKGCKSKDYSDGDAAIACRFNARIEDLTMVEITVTQVAVIFVFIVVNPAMIRRTVSSSRRGIHDPTMPVRITVMPTGLISTHKM